MRSVMSHDFSRIPMTEINRSTFDRSHGLKTTFNSGYLVPIEVQEVLPGDNVNFDVNVLARMNPVVTPIMDNVFLDTFAFFVPTRLVWSNWVKMMGERVNPKDSIDFLTPQINSGTGFESGSLADYFGIPVGVPDLNVNSLPFRAYAKIYDDWFRDENLQDSIIQSSDDIGDTQNKDWNRLLKRGKRHDYFTSALPWPQKGEGVELPIGGLAPVYGQIGRTAGDPVVLVNSSGTRRGGLVTQSSSAGSTKPNLGVDFGENVSSQQTLRINNRKDYGENPFAFADLSDATAVTINSLRMAFQLQKLLERDARGGTRYVEIIRNHFMTICPDARLQRSEYLGGSSQRVVFNEVPNTTADSTAVPQGSLVANGKCFATTKFSKAFTEHGFLIILANVRVDLNYQQGLARMWSRRGRYDYYWPTLQNLGEQAVLNKEIYAQGADVKDSKGNVVDDQVFGYQERYAEYRYNPSIITGKMRSTVDGSLDVWHLAQKFTDLPKLNASFIEDNPPLARVMALPDEPQFICDCYLQQYWTRPMGTYSIPGLIDHL